MIYIAICTALVSTLLTGVALRFAVTRGLLDIPNERSSHSVPVPRTGGVAIVIATLGGIAAMVTLHPADSSALLALGGGGLLVAAVGLADDRGHVPAGIRLIAHFAAAAWALYWLGGLPPLQFGDRLVNLGWTGHVLALLGIVWSINLFNFMDGIDGIAAAQSVTVALGAAMLFLSAGASGGMTGAALVLGCAGLGYLPWNWSPAKIFMGDAGSGFIGFAVSVLAISGDADMPQALFIWWILCGVFFVDATVTLLRRLVRGERPHVAHRSHAYQHLARRFGHARVSLGVVAINVGWLLPIALLALRRPASAWWLVVAALVPLSLIAIRWGAGRREL